jgi:phosphoserine / homoserine phosphotransferase
LLSLKKTGISELRRTTRDKPDFDKLMRGRLAILDQHELKLSDIQQVIGALRRLDLDRRIHEIFPMAAHE